MPKLLVTLLLLGLSGLACSQQPATETAEQRSREEQTTTRQEQTQLGVKTAEGTLARLDADKHFLWIKTAEGQEMQFEYDDSTKVEGAQNSAAGLANMSGRNVRVDYESREAGIDKAVRIEVQEATSL